MNETEQYEKLYEQIVIFKSSTVISQYKYYNALYMMYNLYDSEL